MRKYLIGWIVGVCMAFSVSAYAEEIETLIGKTIQGEFPVTVNGQPMGKKSIVVDGSSYLPVRAIGEATGYTVGFDADLGISLTKDGGTVAEPTPTPVVDTQTKLRKLMGQLEKAKLKVTTDKMFLENARKNDKNPDEIARQEKILAETEAEVTQLEAEIAKLQPAQ